jgi:6-phosphogluconolactonase (cycloisomerase 2 family)
MGKKRVILRSGLWTSLLAGVCLVLTACGTNLQLQPANLSSIVVTASTNTIAAGQTVQLAASATYTDKTSANVINSVSWSSSATSIATVSPSGIVTGIAVGNATITATLGGGTGTFLVTVAHAVLSSVAVTASTNSVAAGLTLQLTATGTYSDGSQQNLTSSVVWTSSAANIANVNSSGGLVTGVAVGQAIITATSGTITGTLQVTVAPPILSSIAVTASTNTVFAGYTLQLAATGTFSDGTQQNLTNSVNWTSSSASFASISSAGLVTGQAAGQATITAAYGAISGTLALTVASSNTVIINPSSQQMFLGGIQQFTASMPSGVVTSTTTWTSSDTGIVTIESGGSRSGLATARGTGTVTLTAVHGTAQATATITVVAQTSRFAITANALDSTLSVSTTNNTSGQLHPLEYFPLPSTIVNPLQIVVHPSGNFAYVSAKGGVGALAINSASGTLTPLATSFYATAASPVGMSFTPSGSYLYVADGTQIFAFAVNATTGALSTVSGSPFANADTSNTVVVDPTGQFLYSSNNKTNKIAAFQIGSGGALQAVVGSPFTCGVSPAGLAFETSGKYLYVANSGDGSIGSYTIDPATGVLALVNTASAGTKPLTLAVAPSGQIYFFDTTGDVIGSVSVNLVTGHLATNAATAPTAASGVLLTFGLSQNFLYAMESPTTSQTEVFSLDINGNPQWANATASRADGVSIAFVPGNQAIFTPTFIYAIAGPIGNTMFNIDPTTGMLSNPVSIGAGR